MESAEHSNRVMERMKQRPRDFIIKAGGRSFPVHRNIISVLSEFFDKLLKSGMKEAEEGCVVLQEVGEQAAEICVNFMYTGQAEITLINVKEVLQGAHMMELSELVEICVAFLKNNLNPEICLEAINMGRLFNENGLVEEAECFLLENFAEVLPTPGFPEIECADLVRYLNEVSVGHEIKWKAITVWMTHNDAKPVAIAELTSAAKLAEFPLEFLFYEVRTSEIFEICPKATEMVLEGIFSDEIILEKEMKLDNCFVLKHLAERHHIENLPSVLEIVANFMAKNLKNVFQDERFCELSFDEIANLLTSKYIIASERTKLRVARRWAKHLKERENMFSRLFQEISLEKIPREILLKNVEFEPLVMESTENKDRVLKSLFRCKNLGATVGDILEYISEEPCIFTFDASSGIIKVICLSSGSEYNLPRVRPRVPPFQTSPHHQQQPINPNQPRDGAIFYINKKLYVSCHEGLHILHNNGRWERKQSTQYGNNWAATTAYEGKIYGVVGRVNASNCKGNVYDTATDTWYEGPWISLEKFKPYSLYYQYDHAYVVAITKDGKQIEPLDIDGLQSFTNFVLVDDILYVVGKQGGRRYDVAENKWKATSAMCVCQRECEVCIVENKLYAVGGDRGALDGRAYGNGQMQDTIEVYDVESDKWSIVHVMDPAVGELAVFGYNPGQE